MTVSANEFFREVTLRVCGSLDINEALSSTFDYMCRWVPIEAIGLGYSDLQSRRIESVAHRTAPGVPLLYVDDRDGIQLSGEGLAYVLDESAPSPLIINRPDAVPVGLLNLFPGLRNHSAIFVRLRLSSQEVGALLVWSSGRDRFSEEDARLLESVREPMTIAMVNARKHRELVQLKDDLVDDHRALGDDLRRALGTEVVGADFGLRQVMDQVRRVAPANSPVLLLGETGTGKEVIANAIHASSPRSRGPMITMQCGAIPDALLDSELFGHEKGAFTGAAQRKRGRFERANSGTLFLDEIGELSLEAQVKLLRVLQERRFERVGGTDTLEVDVQVIAATHRDLEQMVRDGTFREDLWYRLNVLPIRIPPLRSRPEDIPSLVQYFVARKAQEMNRPDVPYVASQDLQRLQNYHWPGNVRELQNVVERALILSSGGRLVFPPLDSVVRRPESRELLRDEPVKTMDEAIAAHIRSVLERTRWKVSGPGGAAQLLEMNPSTLRFRMGKLGISRRTG
ncbi:MAG: sigma 54-interacting transcriptional regulator [Myxococcota bacterium]